MHVELGNFLVESAMAQQGQEANGDYGDYRETLCAVAQAAEEAGIDPATILGDVLLNCMTPFDEPPPEERTALELKAALVESIFSHVIQMAVISGVNPVTAYMKAQSVRPATRTEKDGGDGDAGNQG